MKYILDKFKGSFFHNCSPLNLVYISYIPRVCKIYELSIVFRVGLFRLCSIFDP